MYRRKGVKIKRKHNAGTEIQKKTTSTCTLHLNVQKQVEDDRRKA